MDKMFVLFILFFPYISFSEELNVHFNSNIGSSYVVDEEILGADIDIIKEYIKYKNEHSQISYEVNFSLKPLSDILNEENFDIGIGGISLNKERSYKNFTIPYYETGVSLVSKDGYIEEYILGFNYFLDFISTICNERFMYTLLWFNIILVIFSHTYYPIAKYIDKDERVQNYFTGIFNCYYFCLVASSTVGFGDFTPKGLIAKICIIINIFFGIAMFSNLVSALSVEFQKEIICSIQSLDELEGKVVGTIEGSSSQKLLNKINAIPVVYDNLHDIKKHIDSGEIKYALYDNIPLRSVFNYNYCHSKIFAKEYYSFIINDEELRQEFNKFLLCIQESGELDRIKLKHYD